MSAQVPPPPPVAAAPPVTPGIPATGASPAPTDDFDAKWLLEQVKLAAFGIGKRTSNACKTTYKTGMQCYTFRQAEDEPCEAFLKRFLDFVSNMELAGVDVIHHPYLEELEERTRLKKENPAKTEEAATREAMTNVAEAYRAVTFLMAADSKRFLPLWADLRQEDMLKGQDNFPKMVTRAYNIIRRCETTITSRNRSTESGRGAGGRGCGPIAGRGPAPGRGPGGRGANTFVSKLNPPLAVRTVCAYVYLYLWLYTYVCKLNPSLT